MSRKHSSIWMHFNNVDNVRAQCRICQNKISYKAGSTHNLHRHMRTVHPTVKLAVAELRETSGPASDSGGASTSTRGDVSTQSSRPTPRPTATQSSMDQFMPKSMSVAKQGQIDIALAKMIATDFQPFSIVEDRGFRNYSNSLNPMYTIPSRKTLSKSLIPQLYESTQASVWERVQKATAVCLTTDCWTSRVTTSYMSVTCHFIEDFSMSSCLLDCFEFSDRHTSENLAEELLRVAREWQVDGKVVCCVSDNAANITKAMKMFKWTHHPCLAHTINLIVRDALKVMKPTVDKVKAAVEYFHRSTVGAEKLKSTQRQMGMPELRPKQDCTTRWNSTFYMLKRFLESKDAIISTLAIVNAPVDALTQEEWEVVEEVCRVLEPFEQVTVEISGERYSKQLLLHHYLIQYYICI